MIDRQIKRGQIYWVKLDPSIGSEIKKTRPCLIISNDRNNEYSNVISVIPITSKNLDYIYPFEIFIPKGVLKEDSKAKADHIRTVDKSRVLKLIGQIDKKLLAQVNHALKIQLDLF